MAIGPAARTAELRTKLLWVTVFRTVAITLLLAVSAVRLLANPPPAGPSRSDSVTFVAIGTVYFLTVFYLLWLRRRDVGPGAAWVQMGADIVLATGLVYFTGGADSPYAFTYLLAVLASSILLYQRGALVAAASSSLAFLALTLCIQTEVIPLPEAAEPLTRARLLFAIASNLLAQWLIAALASYLARQLWMTGGKLTAREADLRQLADLQNKILVSMPSGLITCDGEGQVTYMNRSASQILGVEWPPPGDAQHLDHLFKGVRELPPGRRSEVVAETKSGARILGLTTTLLQHAVGETLVVFQDLTELRRVEEALRRSDRLASLGTLSAQLAHEIRNPLAAMRGSAQLLAEEAHPDAQSARLANVLVREADRLSNLVDEFLRFARPPPPSLRPADLAALARETIDMLMTDPIARGVQVGAELQPITAQVDPDQLRQVLINVLKNAFAAAGAGGEVKVTVDDSNGAPRLCVWDSAGSLLPEDMPRLFEPFFTKRPGGTGLGLSTAHSIIRAHGGTIDVTSSPAVGTEFVIGLPATEGARASTGS